MNSQDASPGSLASQRQIAETVGVPAAHRHILLCADQTKPKCCDQQRGRVAWSYLKRRLRELRLSERGGVLRTKANCLRVCEGGPIAVVYPEGVVPGVRSARFGADHPGTSCRGARSRNGLHSDAAVNISRPAVTVIW